MSTDPNYVYVLVRQDLSPSQQAVQACHACLESGKHFPWLGDHPHLVLVGVPNEPSLERWLNAVSQHPHLFKIAGFREPDIGNSLTAVAIAGVSGKLRSYFKPLKLVKFTGDKTMTAIQGRWGFHPCAYELYLKLKRLNLLVLKARRRSAEYTRWKRKHPQNRRIFVGCKGSDQKFKKREVAKCNRVYKPYPEPILAPIYSNMWDIIAADYRNARTPVIESLVKPLNLSEEKIDALLAAMEKWATEKPEIVPMAMVS